MGEARHRPPAGGVGRPRGGQLCPLGLAPAVFEVPSVVATAVRSEKGNVMRCY